MIKLGTNVSKDVLFPVISIILLENICLARKLRNWSGAQEKWMVNKTIITPPVIKPHITETKTIKRDTYSYWRLTSLIFKLDYILDCVNLVAQDNSL